MRLVSFVSEDGSLRAGVVRQGPSGEEVLDIARADPSLPADITELLKHGITGSDAMRRVLDSPGPGIPLTGATLGPAVPHPGKILLLAGNYQSHIAESNGTGVNKAEITPRFFIKPNTSIIGPNDPIRIPVVSDTVDYEIEIAAVIGKEGREIGQDDALDHVAGYLVFNDISARHLKHVEHRTPRPMDEFFDWLVGKWCDSFSVVGPYLVTADEIDDPASLEMALSVNGELRQHSSAGEMIFNVAESIEWISRFVTLEPGDLICMGTPGGVGETTATYLQPGDHVHATISHLGDLNNPVVSPSGE
jgi:2-keto-4-pentenoate hydratase/2-oxohepta-3-ene-1,7-dioic acid hydratase in catechol pathway